MEDLQSNELRSMDTRKASTNMIGVQEKLLTREKIIVKSRFMWKRMTTKKNWKLSRVNLIL